ncbi:MAG: nucleotidyltransferase family protein [Deltaproteobacteria bacterium]|nr:nucleotidyltransferase family protein [Deltaproteobacteria bacterium]
MRGVGIILAAGKGERMGGVAKALLDAGGRTFLQAVVAGVREAGLRAVVVCGGPFVGEVTAAARALEAVVVVNPDIERGMASSIATGLGAADAGDDGDDGALVWPVDHPLVRPATVAAVLAQATADDIVVPTLEGRGGHPVWFGRLHFAALRDPGLGARGGARALLAENPRVIRVNCGDPGVRYDIDTPPDYAKMRLP